MIAKGDPQPEVPRLRLDPPELPDPDPDPAAPLQPVDFDTEAIQVPVWYRPWKPRRPRMGDRRLAVAYLGFTALVATVGDVFLLSNGHQPPGGLLAVAGGCIGALATLVTAAPTRSEPPTHQ